MNPGRWTTKLIGLCIALVATIADAEIVVDGLIEEAEWSTAYTCSDWQRVEPFARDTPAFHNEGRLLSTPQGIAVAFAIDHPRSERRVKPRSARDAQAFGGEYVTFMADFGGMGQSGYEFAVGLGGGARDGTISNQREFDRDWDGRWTYAVSETEDQWFVEMLIPWSTIRVREQAGDLSSIAVYFSRFLFDRNERFACPGISLENPTFLSDFRRIDIVRYEAQPQLEMVPYATVLSDNLNDRTRARVGADFFFQPNADLRASLTLNPDFGQVESDELVVDFSAIETVFTDKRPFFTEDQDVFDLRTADTAQLFYTRRVGGLRDDGLRASDIDAALKVTGGTGALRYGVFGAQEDDYSNDLGRRFLATRVAVPTGRQQFGYMGTFVDRPFFEREALVNELDYEYTGNPWWRGAVQVARSDIETAGTRESGYLANVELDLNRSGALSHSAQLTYIDDRFQLNDMGFLERNSFRQASWDSIWQRSFDEARSPSVSGVLDRVYAYYRENDTGDRLPSRIQLVHEVNYRNGWLGYGDLRYYTSGIDDLISRGNGPVQQDTRLASVLTAQSPRYGNWQFVQALYVYQQGVEDFSAYYQLGTVWNPHEKFTIRFDAIPAYSADWLLWEGEGNLFGSYEAKRLDFDVQAGWFPAPRHELRLRLQWIGIDAEPQSAYRTRADGELFEVPEPLSAFSVNNLGLQIRYRYELGPLSDLYLVYSRGGFEYERQDDSLSGLISRSVDVRDADQLVLKVRYRL